MTKVDNAENLLVFQYFSVLIQAMNLEVEDNLINDLIKFSNEFIEQKECEEVDEEIVSLDRLQYVKTRPPAALKVFMKLLHLQPIKINISLKIERTSSSGMNPASALMGFLASTVGSIEEAPFRFNALMVDNAFGGIDTLLSPVISHFVNQGIKQAYKVFLSIELVGNPFQLVSGLGEGVKDLFYEPYQGLIVSPTAFAFGLQKGALSLVRNTISSVFTSVGTVTGSVGRGIAVLSMDDDYIRKRKRDEQGKGPKHAGEGIAKGVTSLGKGIFSGVTGIFVDPVKGAQKGGVGGFF
eukprot:UN24583